MKRANLARRSPLKPKSSRRQMRAPKRSKYKQRERFISYMLAVKSLPCAAQLIPDHRCEGPIEADHAGPRGIGQKANDATCIPLCRLAHRQRTDFSGVFKGWDQAKMRAFLGDRIRQTQRYLSARGVVVPRMTLDDLRAVAAYMTSEQSNLAPAQRDSDPIVLATIREDGNVDVRYPEGDRQ